MTFFDTILVIFYSVIILGVLVALVWAVSTDERNEKARDRLHRLREAMRR